MKFILSQNPSILLYYRVPQGRLLGLLVHLHTPRNQPDEFRLV
jgi:hypothetical protein